MGRGKKYMIFYYIEYVKYDEYGPIHYTTTGVDKSWDWTQVETVW